MRGGLLDLRSPEQRAPRRSFSDARHTDPPCYDRRRGESRRLEDVAGDLRPWSRCSAWKSDWQTTRCSSSGAVASAGSAPWPPAPGGRGSWSCGRRDADRPSRAPGRAPDRSGTDHSSPTAPWKRGAGPAEARTSAGRSSFHTAGAGVEPGSVVMSTVVAPSSSSVTTAGTAGVGDGQIILGNGARSVGVVAVRLAQCTWRRRGVAARRSGRPGDVGQPAASWRGRQAGAVARAGGGA